MANDVSNTDKQRVILLSCSGANMYGLIWSLAVPSKPTVIPYTELVNSVTAHFNPRPSKTVSHFKFHSRSQQPGASIAIYVSELWKLSEFSEYGKSLDDML